MNTMQEIEPIKPDFDFSTITSEEIEAELKVIGSKLPDNLLTVRTANSWIESAKLRPVPKKLFKEFFYENELCILFADTNTGKSILAVQIGDEQQDPTLYGDFELTDKQFQLRYSDPSNTTDTYLFNSNFYRAEINPDALPPGVQSFEDYLYESLERSITDFNIRILIIDNITYLRTETEKAKDALPLMKQLKRLKSKFGLSILCLAHTPKRDMTKPITRNDLMGSKMLINFCDSAFAIGESVKDKSIRYLKQIKTRNGEIVYDSENVINAHIVKDNNFLRFDFTGFGDEAEHLRQLSDKEKESRISEVLELHNKGVSNVQIGLQFGVSETAVRKWLKKALASNLSNPSNHSSSSSSGTSSKRHEV